MEFSIITCTYNPNQQIFSSLVRAIEKLRIQEDTVIEWLIIDNNCNPPLVLKDFIRCFTSDKLFIRIIRELKQGLTSARIRGINEAKYDWIFFFDDDNEPAYNYLIEAKRVIQSNELVACWGPGKIEVVFHSKNRWINKYKHIYQERYIKGIKTYDAKEWQAGYPQGTGQIINKELLLDYIKKVETGIYSMSDREGKSLSSGGDVQIVLNAIKAGYKVGTSESLSLKHNIEASKANFRYLFKLIYGMASSAVLSQIQVFPELAKEAKISNRIILKTIALYFRQFKIKSFNRDKLLVFAQRMGDLNASYIAYHQINSKPIILKIIERFCF